jgi:glycosyltransferase involved in cell wall biosynthesis
MKIIYIHQYFKTYQDGGSSRSYYLAKALTHNGYEVEMITSHNQPAYKKVNLEGIIIHYLPVYYDNAYGFIGRVRAFINFVVKTYQLARSIKDASLCYATSTPLTVGIIALLLKKFHNLPFYFEVRDLWPKAPIEMGVIRNSILKKIAYTLEHSIYQQAEKIIALSPGMAQEIASTLGTPEKIHVIPNMADCDFFQIPEVKANTHTFTISYFGAVGKVNQLSSLIDIARYFQEKQLSNVKFIIAGKGKEYSSIQTLSQSYNLTNIQFLPHVDKYKLKEILALTDVVYISFAQNPVLETSSPNKFFDALAAGKVCIVNTRGWLKDCIEESGCGFYAHPEKPEIVYKKLLPYLASKRKLKEAKESARFLAQTQFSRTLLTGEFLKLFSSYKIPAPASRKEIISNLE